MLKIASNHNIHFFKNIGFCSYIKRVYCATKYQMLNMTWLSLTFRCDCCKGSYFSSWVLSNTRICAIITANSIVDLKPASTIHTRCTWQHKVVDMKKQRARDAMKSATSNETASHSHMVLVNTSHTNIHMGSHYGTDPICCMYDNTQEFLCVVNGF